MVSCESRVEKVKDPYKMKSQELQALAMDESGKSDDNQKKSRLLRVSSSWHRITQTLTESRTKRRIGGGVVLALNVLAFKQPELASAIGIFLGGAAGATIAADTDFTEKINERQVEKQAEKQITAVEPDRPVPHSMLVEIFALHPDVIPASEIRDWSINSRRAERKYRKDIRLTASESVFDHAAHMTGKLRANIGQAKQTVLVAQVEAQKHRSDPEFMKAIAFRKIGGVSAGVVLGGLGGFVSVGMLGPIGGAIAGTADDAYLVARLCGEDIRHLVHKFIKSGSDDLPSSPIYISPISQEVAINSVFSAARDIVIPIRSETCPRQTVRRL